MGCGLYVERPDDAAAEHGDAAKPEQAEETAPTTQPPTLMKIRPAEFNDIPDLVDLARRFLDDHAQYWGGPRKLDPPGFARHLCTLIGRRDAGFFVGETEDGELAGWIALLLLPDIYSGGMVAMKLHWLTADAHRGRGKALLRAGEAWARENGARQAIVAALHDRPAALLKKLGYAQLEISYCKDLGS